MSIDGVSTYIYHQGGVSAGVEDQEKGQRAEHELTDEEKGTVNDLKKRDREVRAHEMAHVAAGGQYVTGGASYEYQTGPDNKKYAVGGEVSIDSSPVKGDPEATIQKMRVVRKTALAPANPSAKDRSVAAKASQAETKARMELREEKAEEAGEKPGASGTQGIRISSYASTGELVPAQPTASGGVLDLIG